MDKQIDEWIGEYHLTKLIGPGASSTVFRACKKGSEEEVAIKMMRDHFPNRDPVLKDKFLQEVEILKTLDHDHIVKLIEVIFKNTDYGQMAHPCIVMPYMPGGTLRKLLNENDFLPLETIHSYMHQITEALSYAHSCNVAHCDVKPENILLSEDGNKVFLADFGIAQKLSEIHSTMRVTTGPAGTATYMAPEQFEGHPSRRSDQYALAIILYECLCGSLPFEGTNYNQLSKQHGYARVPSLRQKCRSRGRKISKETEQIILKALAKEKVKRYSNIQVFAEALDKALALEIKREEERHRKTEQAHQAKEEQSRTYFANREYIVIYFIIAITVLIGLLCLHPFPSNLMYLVIFGVVAVLVGGVIDKLICIISPKVAIYKHGLILSHFAKRHSISFAQIESVGERIYESPDGYSDYTQYAHSYFLKLIDGTQVDLPDCHVEEEIGNGIADRLLPSLLDRYHRGQLVEFGGLSVSSQGVQLQKRLMISWDKIQEIRMIGNMYIKMIHTDSGATEIELSEVSNFQVLKRLLAAIPGVAEKCTWKRSFFF